MVVVTTWAAVGVSWVLWRGFQLQDEQAVTHAVAKQIVRAVDRGELPAVAVVDNDGVIFDWSLSGQIMTGWTKEEIVGRDLEILVPPEMAAKHEKAFSASARRFGKARKGGIVDCDMMTKSGARLPVRVTIYKAGDDHFTAVIAKRQGNEPAIPDFDRDDGKKMPKAQ